MNASCASLDDSVGGMGGDRTWIASDGLISIPYWISRALHLLLFTVRHMHLYI